MTKTKNAIIISGGGAKGAFGAGVITALSKRIEIYSPNTNQVETIGGTSTGALIAPFAALCFAKESNYREQGKFILKKCYTQVETKDILKKKNIFQLLWNMDSLYTTEPLRKLIEKYLTDELFYYLKYHSFIRVYVSFVDFATGKLHNKWLDESTRGEFIDYMLASASVPLVLNSVKREGGILYDGGVRDITPLKFAIKNGAEKLLIILNQTGKLKTKQAKNLLRFDKIALRLIDIMLNEIFENDLIYCKKINKVIRYYNLMKKELPLNLQDVLNTNLIKDKREINVYPLIKIPYDIENSLEFNKIEMQKLYKHGLEYINTHVADYDSFFNLYH